MIVTNNTHIKTQAQQLYLLHKAVVPNLLIVLVVATIYAFVLWGTVDSTSLNVWLVLALALTIVRMILFQWRWKILTIENANTFKQFILIGNLISGLLWGLSTIWFFPDQLEYQLFMLFMLGGLALGASNSDVNYLAGYYAYVWSSLLPLVIALYLIGEKIQLGISVSTIFYIVAISIYGRAFHKNIYESIKLRFENDGLVQKLEEKTLIAEKANTSKSKFLATASHDLRQPLHSSGILLDALKFTLEKDSQIDILDKLVHSHDHLSALFDSLLDISNLDSGSVNVNIQSVSITKLYSSLWESYHFAAEEKGLLLNIDAIEGCIKTDPILMNRILGNLLSNAIRYTFKGSINLKAVREPNNQVLITVSDTGIGIANEYHQQVFDEFEQLNNSHRDHRLGLGLGLSIVKRLSDLLEHNIQLVSTEGSGTTFSLRCQKGHQEQQNMPVDSMSKNIEIERALTILFVDDERPIRDAIGLVLDNFDMHVITAESASDAIAKLKKTDISLDVIVTDYRLKDGETGLDVIDTVREFMNDNTLGIIVTGEINFHDIAPAQEKGYAVLHKPISSSALIPLLLESVNSKN
jgi:signal transduction histidine kinase/CheY-like chemotaxis protein